MKEHEEVLVFPTAHLIELGLFQGMTLDLQKYFPRLLEEGSLQFMPRGSVERNPNFKQIIPYVLLNHLDAFLCYTRSKDSGDERLRDLTSIGVGGHVNADDFSAGGKKPFLTAYAKALRREVGEELHVESEYQDRIVGLINDDSNEVGMVHLGVVHILRLRQPNVRIANEELEAIEFLTPEKLRTKRKSLESWSQICLDNLGEIVDSAGITLEKLGI